MMKTFFEQRQEILAHLEKRLEPHPHVYALWLEGADARDIVDEFSDIDLWLDVEDGHEEKVLSQLERYLQKLGSLDMVQKRSSHPDPKIKQCFFHLSDTSEFLIVDVCIQSHSREFEFGSSDPVKVIFDKSGVIRFSGNTEVDVLARAKAIQPQVTLYRIWVLKALKRGHWLEAISYYHECILEPLAQVLRLRYTPEKVDYGFKHFDQDLPDVVVARVKALTKVDSSGGLESNLEKAVEWLNKIVREL
jgi:predicted nucleotidyltransferase